jgi:prevent-host-death family protein
MKSLPVPVAHARNNFSDVLEDAQRGQRIRLTRHGKPVGWIIGAEERQRLESAPRGKAPRATKSRRR